MNSILKEAANLYHAAEIIKDVKEILPRNWVRTHVNPKTKRLEYIYIYKREIYSYPNGFSSLKEQQAVKYIPCAYKDVPIKVLDKKTQADIKNEEYYSRQWRVNYPYTTWGW